MVVPLAGPFGPDLLPALERAVSQFDMSGLTLILSLIHETMDQNRDGTLDRKEVKAFWDLMGGAFCSLFMGEGQIDPADIAWALIDQNGDGKVSLDEVTGLVEKIFKIFGALFRSVVETVSFVMTSAEARTVGVQLLAMSPVMQMDENQDGVISRAEFKQFMENAGVATMAGQMLSQVGVMSSSNCEFSNSIKEMRASLAAGEEGIRSQLMLKAADWFNSGVDEVTFIAQVSPLLKKSISQPVDQAKIVKSIQTFQQQLKQFSGMNLNVDTQKMDAIAGDFSSNPEIMAINQKVQESVSKNSAQYAPDLCRNIFQLLDLDKSGRITHRELNVLKALMDGFLRIGTSTLKDTESLSEADKAELKKMYPDLFVVEGAEGPTLVEEVTALLLAIFDVVDRDGDGSLQQDEIVDFITGLISFIMQHMRIMSNVMVDTMVSMEKEMLKLLWTKLGLTEVSKKQVPEVGMSIMMLAMSAMPQQ